MGEALLAGLLAEGTATAAGLWATDVDSDRLSALQKRYGIQTGRDNREAASWADVLVLAVKPQMMSRVLDDLKDHLPEATLVISVATGISLARIAAALGGNRKLVRVMTNTPVLVRAGASALAISPLVSPQDRALAIRLFEAVGRVILVDEHLMDAVTGLSGSGPAYIFQVIDALADGGVKMGLPRDYRGRFGWRTAFGAC